LTKSELTKTEAYKLYSGVFWILLPLYHQNISTQFRATPFQSLRVF